MSVRFDEAPLAARPLIEFYGWAVAFFLFLYVQILRFTCRIQFQGFENLKSHPHALWACWHEHVPSAFAVLPIVLAESSPQVWMNHPVWSMRPIHLLLRMYGIRVVMGASGEKGRAAALEIIESLNAGASTALNPDGPAGPKRVLKKGILQFAQESGLPVLAFRYHARFAWTMSSWDEKRVPFPFSVIEVEVSEPIFVSGNDDLTEKAACLTRVLSGL